MALPGAPSEPLHRGGHVGLKRGSVQDPECTTTAVDEWERASRCAARFGSPDSRRWWPLGRSGGVDVESGGFDGGPDLSAVGEVELGDGIGGDFGDEGYGSVEADSGSVAGGGDLVPPAARSRGQAPVSIAANGTPPGLSCQDASSVWHGGSVEQSARPQRPLQSHAHIVS